MAYVVKGYPKGSGTLPALQVCVVKWYPKGYAPQVHHIDPHIANASASWCYGTHILLLRTIENPHQ